MAKALTITIWMRQEPRVGERNQDMLLEVGDQAITRESRLTLDKGAVQKLLEGIPREKSYGRAYIHLPDITCHIPTRNH